MCDVSVRAGPARRFGFLFAVALAAPVALVAQGGVIAGAVVNRASGAPVPSAQVAVAGTTLRTLTDAGGRFRLADVPGARVVLQVRVIGFRSAEDTVAVGDLEARIVLDQKALELNQVVVTGTPAATTTRALGNAVSHIDAASVTQATPINDVQSLLNGRAAGVLIQPATGAVGSGSRIRIRGASSFSLSSQPLVYVDGIRVDANFASGPTNQDFGSSSISRFNDFNPDDIGSVEIAKGPAAATLYGTEASNGVIQIISKRGQPGPARWDFTVRQGIDYFSNPDDRFPTNYQVDNAGNLISINLKDLEAQVGDIFRTGHLADYEASVSGGTNAVQYYVAGGTELQGGAEPSNDFRHTSGRASLTVTPSEKVTVTSNIGYVSGPTHLSCEAGCGGRMFTTFYMNPRNLGTFRLGFHSGLPYAYDEEYHFAQGLDRFTGSIQLQHHPVSWFSHRVTFGVDRTHEVNSLYQPLIDSLQQFFGSDALGYVAITDRAVENTTLDYAATATLDLSPTLRSSASAGLQFYHAVIDTTFADGQFFPAPGLSAIDATTGPRTNAGGLEETKSIGAYGQEQLAWRDRLFVTAGLRSDNQSTFGKNFTSVYYPKASVSWVMSDEAFWHYPFINQLRLRAAYGESGRAPPYNAAVPTYTTATGPGDVPAVTRDNAGNPNLGPERGKEIELGFDAALWNDRLGLEFTYYRKKTTDEILSRLAAPSIGVPTSTPQYFNAGAVLNSGIELLARARPYARGPVTVDLTFNLATNSNKIQSLLPGVTSVSPGTFLLHKVGYPVGSWFAKRVVSAQLDSVGRAINVLCDNGNGGTVACASAPSVYLGRTIPNVEGAFSPTVALWNRVRLGALLDFKTGYKKLDGNTRVRCTIFLRCIENFRPLQGDPIRVAEEQTGGIPDFYINDASFLKLRELSVSYSLPDRWVRAIGASRAMVSLAGRNLHTWTGYPGLEPEAMFLGGSRGGNFSAWEQADLPQLAQWIVTVNVGY
jgi:TonB-linked SusC/RagA family outer membrane protein